MRRLDRRIVAWCFYDFANSSVSAIVVATIFPVWYAQVIVGDADGRGDFWWGLASSTTMVIVALTAPLLGGIADHAGVRKPFFVGLTLMSVIGSALLATLEPGMVVRGFLLAVLTLVTYEAAIVYYNAYLPQLAPPERLGSVSAAGFAVGYAGSIVAFIAAYPFAAAKMYGACFIVTAAQFGLFALPAFLTLPADTRHPMPLTRALARGVAGTLGTLREIVTAPAHLALRRFLLAYFIFEDGVNTVIFFAGIFASKTLGFSFPEIIVLFMLVQLTALIGSAAWARPSDRRGPKFVITITLVQWIAVTMLTYAVRTKWQFWIVAILAGTGLGAIQAASRAFMASLVPRAREAEFFGFYALVGKTGAVLGPLVFGGVSWAMSGDQRSAIAAIGLFFVVGLLLLSRVPVAALGASLVLVVIGAGAAEPAEPLTDLAIGKGCRDFLHKRMLAEPGARLVLGHLYYAEDGAPTACGWSATSPYAAYSACAGEATKRAIAAPCLLIVKDSVVVARSYADARRQASADAWELSMASDPLRCGQEPGTRRYWVEHGFCDLKVHGPDKGRGIVIWNHGILGGVAQYRGAPALALRLLHASGWDVIKLNRHNLAEGADSYRSGEERTQEEITAQRARGYRRIVVAGQSFGGRVALEVGAVSDLFALVAMAPGMETTVGNTRTQAPTDDRLRRSKAERVAVVFPGQDELFGNVQRGSTAVPALAGRGRPYFIVDESGGLKGHGGGTGGNFALRYGRCLDEFLSAPTVPGGRFECPAAGGGWSVARELLPALPPSVSILPPERLSADLRDVAGLWYGVLGESIVAWALVDAGKPGVSIFYAWVTSGTSRGGGVYEAVMSPGEVKAVLPNRAVLAVKTRDARTLAVTWTPVPGESNFGIVARKVEPLHGELVPVDAR